MLTVDIDSNSGFCAGVIRAIGKAEEFLKDSNGEKRLYSLGAIVHNDAAAGMFFVINLNSCALAVMHESCR